MNGNAVFKPSDGWSRVAISHAGKRNVTSNQSLEDRRWGFSEGGWGYGYKNSFKKMLINHLNLKNLKTDSAIYGKTNSD